MDRREAIGALEWLRLKAAKPIYSNMHEALDLAIGALQEPITIRKVVLEPTNPETLLEQGMRSLDGLEAELFVKEKHQLSGETPTISEKESVVGDAESATTTDCISRADAIAYIDRIFNSGLGRRKSLDYIRKYISALPPVNQKQITGKLKTLDDSLLTDDSEACKEQKSKLDTDLISRQAAIELACWRCKKCERKDCEYKDSCETMRLLDALPSEDPKPPMLNNDCISREQAIEAMAPFDTNHELRDTLDNLPPVIPTEHKTTETMIVDGMEVEIDPLSYEVGYTHGQFSERPKGEWIFNPKDAIDLMFTRPKCNKCGFESDDGGNFCSNCGCRMTGDGGNDNE